MCGDFRRLDRVAVLARLRDELKSLSNSVTAKRTAGANQQ